MKRILHVNQHRIRGNIHKSPEDRQPPVTIRTYKGVTYGNEVEILDKDGQVAAKLVYSPDKPLNCGARLWIETQNEVRVTS